MCYGNKIKQYLNENGIKYKSVSEKTGISMNVLSPMLNGKRKIVVEEYFKICDALEKPYDYFTYDNSEKTENRAA